MSLVNRKLEVLRSTVAIFWLGFFMSISFMEAPLKFTVLSLPQGLSVGRLIFKTLNTCEWMFLVILGITLLFQAASRRTTTLILLMCVILILESIWLLPLLDARASQIINGITPTGNSVHVVYVVLEILKVPVLLLIAWQGINECLKNTAS